MKKFFVPFKTQMPSRTTTGNQNTFLDCMPEDESAESNQSSSFLAEYTAFKKLQTAASAGNTGRVELMLSLEQNYVNDRDRQNSSKKRLKEYEKELHKASCRNQEPELELNSEDDKTSLDNSNNDQLENDPIKSPVSLEEKKEETKQLISNESERDSWESDEEDSFFHSKETPKINLRKKWKAFKISRNIQGNSGLPWSDDTDSEKEKEENVMDPAFVKEENALYLKGKLLQEKEEAEDSPWDSENVSESLPFIFAGNGSVAMYEAAKESPEKYEYWKGEKTEPAIGQNQNGMTCKQDLGIEMDEDLSCNSEEEIIESANGQNKNGIIYEPDLRNEYDEDTPCDSERKHRASIQTVYEEQRAANTSEEDLSGEPELEVKLEGKYLLVDAYIPMSSEEEQRSLDDSETNLPQHEVISKEKTFNNQTKQVNFSHLHLQKMPQEAEMSKDCDKANASVQCSLVKNREKTMIKREKLQHTDPQHRFQLTEMINSVFEKYHIDIFHKEEPLYDNSDKTAQSKAEEKGKKHKTKKDYTLNKLQVPKELLHVGGGDGDDSAVADDDGKDDFEEEENIEEEEDNKDLSDVESILHRKKENADKHKLPIKKSEDHDKHGHGPFCHFEVTKEGQDESSNSLESENMPASEKSTSASCHQVKDEESSSKIDLDGGRCQDKSSYKKYKSQKQTHPIEDQNDLPHSSDYDYSGPSNQKDLFYSHKKLTQSKKSRHELLKEKMKKIKNEIGRIRTEQYKTKEMKAHLENRKVELTELRNLRYLLQQEIKKNGSTVHISENILSVLRENKEQCNKAVGVERPEISLTTICMELNDIKTVLKKLQGIKSQRTEVVHNSKKIQDHHQKFKTQVNVAKKTVYENENGESTFYEDLETRKLAMNITILRDEVNDFKEKVETISYKHLHLNENIQCKIQELSVIKNIQKKYEYLHMKQKKIEGEISILTSYIQEKMKQAADQANLNELTDKNTGQRISQLKLIFKDMKLKHSKIKAKNDGDKMDMERHKQDYMEVCNMRKALSNTLIQMKEILDSARKNCQLYETEDKMSTQKQAPSKVDSQTFETFPSGVTTTSFENLP
ncbi:uncharacterized protein RHO17_025798 [Thomomys bottae]